MRTRGAVIHEPPGQYEIVDLELEEPWQNEVMVKMVASGLCHTDDHLATGDIVTGIYPICGGHEGAGIVVQVGPHTPGWSEGDHVVFSFLPSCGRCRWCAQGMQNLCDLGSTTLRGSRLGSDPPTFRMSYGGKPVGQMSGLSTFSEYTTVSVNSAVKVPDGSPLEKICLLGCAVGTGWGSAVNSAGVRPGETVIVMGVGGIGINAVQGASHAGASNVIAVDPVEFKLKKALELGATHSASSMLEATDLARSLTNGQGADAAIVTVGITTGEHVAQAFASVRKAGVVVVTGAAKNSEVGIPIQLNELTMWQKRVQGSLFGASNPTYDILAMLELYNSGKLHLDELITNTYSLDQIVEGYKDMHLGRNIRGVIHFQ